MTNIPDIHLDYVADEERLSQLFNTLDKGNDGWEKVELTNLGFDEEYNIIIYESHHYSHYWSLFHFVA